MSDVQVREEKKLPRIQPFCSICEDDGILNLRIEMPGVDKNGIVVRIEKNELLIEGKQMLDEPADNEPAGKWLLQERRRGNYFKRFIIDESIDREKVDAKMQDGVLHLSLYTRESAKPRKIEIK